MHFKLPPKGRTTNLFWRMFRMALSVRTRVDRRDVAKYFSHTPTLALCFNTFNSTRFVHSDSHVVAGGLAFRTVRSAQPADDPDNNDLESRGFIRIRIAASDSQKLRSTEMCAIQFYIFAIDVHPRFLALTVRRESVASSTGKMFISAAAHVHQILILDVAYHRLSGRIGLRLLLFRARKALPVCLA